MSRLGQFFHYAFWTLPALLGIAASEALLQSGHAVYLHFDHGVFAQQWQVLLASLLVAGAVGAGLDHPPQPDWLRKLPRFLLVLLLCIAVFQIARRSPDANWTAQRWAKLSALTACTAVAAAAANWLSGFWLHRLAGALGLVCFTVFALQPGMIGWLLASGSDRLHAASSTALPTAVAQRRVIVLLLDEWDQEVSEREGFFKRPELQTVFDASYRNTAMRAAGPSTLTSVPGMLRGTPFGKVDKGGVGYLVSQVGERFDASQALLFQDMERASLPYGVVGFYHDYCRLAPQARRCTVEPMHFFPGWWSALIRPIKPAQDLQDSNSSFLSNWRQTYATLHREAMLAVNDRQLQFTWLHLNLPHPPSVIDAPAADLLGDYRRNLGVAAGVIRDIRNALAAQPQPSAFVLISDHWLREKEFWGPLYLRQLGAGHASAGKSADQRVPMVVWFSDGQGRGLVDHSPRDATQLRHLVAGLLSGHIAAPADVATALSDGAVVH
ncbi:sulfatase-like hydrolase/transferase [Roseateles sp.]|uniref:sulfatase-like hydrolase/transferase n=1 Tax=Roseateles sp. TaxID=1971397 RepID=UPI003BAAEEFD